jgi:hypothetical protein
MIKLKVRNFNNKINIKIIKTTIFAGGASEIEKRRWLNVAKTFTAQKADGLPYETRLQINGQYFVTTNIDVSDGLFNGATGILKKIEYGTSKGNEKIPKNAYLEFHHPSIGANKRSLTKAELLRKGIDLKWVQIGRITKNLSKTGRHKGIRIIRTQLPLLSANAVTIPKSQGSSIPFVVVSVTTIRKKKITREELYVACSRATSLNGLFINGNFVPPATPAPDNPVTLEMEKLRKNPLQFSLKFLQDFGEEFEKIYLHNVQSYVQHHPDVEADHCAMSSNFLALVEPHLRNSDKINLPAYTCIHRTDCRQQINSEGVLLFRRNILGKLLILNLFIKLLKQIYFADSDAEITPTITTDFVARSHCLFLQWKTSGVSIVVMYKSPEYPKCKFLRFLDGILEKTTIAGIYLGDININIQKLEGQNVIDLFQKHNYTSKLNIDSPSTDGGSHIDVCFSNVPHLEAWFYECYYSYHKPICVTWKK